MGVGAACLREVGIHLDAVADIHDEEERRGRLVGGEERRGRLVGGEVAGVALGLPASAPHGVVPCFAAAHGAGFLFTGSGVEGEGEFGGLGDGGDELLCLQHEAAAPVEVEAAIGGGAGAGGDFDGELEGVAVGVRVGGIGDAEDFREADEEGLGVGALGGFGFGPVGDEVFDFLVCLVGHLCAVGCSGEARDCRKGK